MLAFNIQAEKLFFKTKLQKSQIFTEVSPELLWVEPFLLPRGDWTAPLGLRLFLLPIGA